MVRSPREVVIIYPDSLGPPQQGPLKIHGPAAPPLVLISWWSKLFLSKSSLSSGGQKQAGVSKHQKNVKTTSKTIKTYQTLSKTIKKHQKYEENIKKPSKTIKKTSKSIRQQQKTSKKRDLQLKLWCKLSQGKKLYPGGQNSNVCPSR